MRAEGVIVKALSGFYYVSIDNETIRCRARGLFRLEGVSPLVGDKAVIEYSGRENGTVRELKERRNAFERPAVANVDLLVVVCAACIPATDPFLIDQVSVIAEHKDCGVLICINKSDIDRGERLLDIYGKTPFKVISASAVTMEGVEELRELLAGKVSAFTGNSGVGKSSLLNALDPRFDITTGEVSEKLGRGRHTTRHVELFSLGVGAYIADTPGFASFDVERMEGIGKDEMQFYFPEFEPYFGQCRFNNCAHLREPGCAVIEALTDGVISPDRHMSYTRLYSLASEVDDWERRKR